MSINSTTTEKGEESIADHERADTASDAFLVGVDSEGREHYFSRIRGCVTVLNDGEHEHTEPLDNGALSEWMRFIEAELGGWNENNTYSGSVADHLCDQLATAVNGGGTQ